MKSYVAAVVVALQIFNMPLTEGFTTARLGLLFGMAYIILLRLTRLNFRISTNSSRLIGPGILIVFAATVGIFISGGSLTGIVTYLGLVLSAIVVAEVFRGMKREDLDKFFWCLTTLTTIAITAAAATFWGEAGSAIRSNFRGFFAPGLSRFNNALIVSSAVCYLGWALNAQTRRMRSSHAAWFLLPTLLAAFFALYVGSRQSLVALTVFIGVVSMPALLMTLRNRRDRRLAVRSLFVVSCIGGAVVYLYSSGMIDAGIQARWYALLVDQELRESDWSRLRLAEQGLQLMFQSYGFGVGYGNFVSTVGMSAHNGYIAILAESGVFSGGMILGTIGVIVWSIVKQYHRLIHVQPLLFWAVVGTTVLILFANLFNGLIRDPIFFALLGVLMGILQVQGIKVAPRGRDANPIASEAALLPTQGTIRGIGEAHYPKRPRKQSGYGRWV